MIDLTMVNVCWHFGYVALNCSAFDLRSSVLEEHLFF